MQSYLATYRAVSTNLSCALFRELRILIKFPNKHSPSIMPRVKQDSEVVSGRINEELKLKL